ncbi:DUF262 domain-containing protein [Streptomyces sp. NPDC001902]
MAPSHNSTSLQLTLSGIGELLSGSRLSVPQFQRSYCWSVDQEVRDYWDDISRAVGSGEEYFLGTIVLTLEGPDERKTIIDGQQRLVTSSLFIAAIRDQLRGLRDEKADLIGTDFLARETWDSDGKEARLRLNEEDDPLFHAIVAKNQLPVGPIKKNTSDIDKAYLYFRERIGDLASSYGDKAKDVLKEWIKYLKTKAQLAVVETSSEADAYVIFETLNNRGADLTTADLLKNHLFGVAKQHLDAVRNNWVKAVGALNLTAADAKFTAFLRHYWSSRVGKVTERELYARMKAEIRQSWEALEFSKELLEAARIYSALSDANHQLWKEKCSHKLPEVDTLAMFNLAPNKILMLAAVEKFDAKQLEALMRALVNWSVRGMVLETINSGRTEEKYSYIASEIRKDTVTKVHEVRQMLTDTVAADGDFRDQFALATVPKSRGKIARYYLAALERTKANKPQPELVPNENANMVNLEHVFPQNADQGAWPEFDRAEEAERWIYRLGNMVLLPSGQNSKIGNKGFVEKAEFFQNSELALTREVGETSSWSPAAVEARQERLAELAVKTWPR